MTSSKTDPAPIVSINPTTGEQLEQYEADDARVDAALNRSIEAFSSWRAQSFGERAAYLRAVARVLRDRAEEHARLMTLEMGKPIREARAEIEKCAAACEYFAEHAEEFLGAEVIETDATASFVRYDPLGTVLAVMPWNFPFWQVFRFAAPALMAGNVGILKHASNVPGCSRAIEGVFREAGLPEGVFQSLLVSSTIAEDLVGDERIAAVTLTGSEGAGRAIGAAAGRAIKPCVLELGGSDPFVILADADVPAAIEAAVQARTINGGQSCIAAKRFIVEAPVYQQVVEGMRERMADLVVGDPLEEATDIGPLAKSDLVNDLFDQVRSSAESGARLVLGGGAQDGPGNFYQPTLLADCAPEMTVMREETFGPVAALAKVEDEEEAIRLANGTRFGLGAALWTTAERARDLIPRIEAGHVAVNGIVKSDPRLPFGGIKRSGIGRELSRPGIQSFVNTKAVWIG